MNLRKLLYNDSSISLTRTLTIGFVLISSMALILAMLLQLVLNLIMERGRVASEQRAVAQQTANELNSFIEQTFYVMEATVEIGLPLELSAQEQTKVLQRMYGLQPSLREIALLDGEGQEFIRISRQSIMPPNKLQNLSDTELFRRVSKKQRYIGEIFLDQTSNEPHLIMAIPIENILGVFEGALIVEADVTFMWQLVTDLQLGETGHTYVVNRQGRLLAFADRERVMRRVNVAHLEPVAQFQKNQPPTNSLYLVEGINGADVLATYVPLGQPDWAVVVELPFREAYQELWFNMQLSGAILLLIIGLAAFFGTAFARRIAQPLHNLTRTASQIAAGKRALQAAVVGPKEVVQLAEAFNSMTAQLRESIDSLETRVLARTHRLELVANLSERLTAILDLDELLEELVNQVKGSFNYYHVHFYLVDEGKQKLLMTAGAGEAGAKMKANGHRIALNVPQSVVAQAARTGEIVRVDDVTQLSNWLPNPHLPATKSEMAVPVILNGKVVGVLDVQEDKEAAFDKSDATLLRSLANQAAVAIRNAKIFANVEASLEEARMVQDRYQQQAWERVRNIKQAGQYYYQRTEAPPVDDQYLQRLEEQLLAQNGEQPIVQTGEVDFGAENKDSFAQPQPASLVVPIKLQNQLIGMVQLHNTTETHVWHEQELALVQAVTDQMAQVAENLRLLDETRERAGREQLIREVTDKLRTASDIDSLLQIAARELGLRLGTRHTFLEVGITKAAPAQEAPSKRNK